MKRVISQQTLTPAQWGQVVIIAGIGTMLEWFDFYTYTQLNATLEKVFFPTSNETIQALSFWGVYAAGFVVRPIGALIFGHIGDTLGRNKCLLISICAMAFSTVVIGVLPTYETGSYRAGIAAPVLLACCRILQGLAMGGEFGSAVIYISELAPKNRRGLYVAILQSTVNVGMTLATVLVMILQNTLSTEAMLTWGWRIPFLCAFVTALLGAFLRQSMPEPKAFLRAARAEKRLSNAGAHTAAADSASSAAASSVGDEVDDVDGEVPDAEAGDSAHHGGILEKVTSFGERLHGHSHARVPIVRLIRNNALGLVLNICFMAWVSGAFYTTVSWLAKDLRTYGYPLVITQGILIVSLIPNTLGLLTCGKLLDYGVPAIQINAAVVAIGVGLGFAVYPSVGISAAHAWGLVAMFHYFIGIAMAIVALPMTRVYEPLSRTTGFSFAYNCGYGVIGGLSPLAVSAIKAGLNASAHSFAPALWLLCLAAFSVVGIIGLFVYQPRLAKPKVGHIE